MRARMSRSGEAAVQGGDWLLKRRRVYSRVAVALLEGMARLPIFVARNPFLNMVEGIYLCCSHIDLS